MADNTISIDINLNTISPEQVNKTVGDVNALKSKLEKNIVLKVSFDKIETEIKSAVNSFKSLESEMGKLKTVFSDITKISGRYYSDMKKNLASIGAISQKSTSNIASANNAIVSSVENSNNKIVNSNKAALAKLKDQASDAKKLIAITPAGPERQSAIFDYTQKEKDYQFQKMKSSGADFSNPEDVQILKAKYAIIDDMDRKFRTKMAEEQTISRTKELNETKKSEKEITQILKSEQLERIAYLREVTSDKQKAISRGGSIQDWEQSAKRLSDARSDITGLTPADVKRQYENIEAAAVKFSERRVQIARNSTNAEMLEIDKLVKKQKELYTQFPTDINKSDYSSALDMQLSQKKIVAAGKGTPLSDKDINDEILLNQRKVDRIAAIHTKANQKLFAENNKSKLDMIKTERDGYAKQLSIGEDFVKSYRKSASDYINLKSQMLGLSGTKKDDFIASEAKKVDTNIKASQLKGEINAQKESIDVLKKYYSDRARIINGALNEEALLYKKYRMQQLDSKGMPANISTDDSDKIKAQREAQVDAEIKAFNKKNSFIASSKKQEIGDLDSYYNEVKFKDKDYYEHRMKQINQYVSKKQTTLGLDANQEKLLRTKLIKDLEDDQKRALGNNLGIFQNFMSKLRGFLVLSGGFYVVKQVITAVVASAIEFQDVMAGVRAVTKATDDEFKRLSDSARELGSSTRYTATEVAQLQDVYAKLGLSVNQILSASAPALDLATATGENLAESAEAVAVTLNGFGLEASKTGRIVDVMAQSFVDSALDLDRYSEAMKMVAPVAKTVNFSMEETTALLAQLSNVGITGTMAGTGLRNVLSQVSDSSSKLSKVLGGTANNWQEFIGLLNEANKRGTAFKEEALSELDLRIKGIVINLAENASKLDTVAVGYNNAAGAAERMAAVRLDTVAGDMKLFASAWNEEKIQMFDKAEGSLRKLIQVATFLTGGFAEATSVLVDFTEGFLIAGSILGTIAVMEKLITVLGTLNTMAIASRAGLTGLSAAGAITKSMLSELWAVMMANPLIALGAAIGGLIVVFNYLSTAEERAIEKQREFNKEFGDTIAKGRAEIIQNLELIKQYNELSAKPIDEKSKFEQERESEILKQLISLYPELGKGQDAIIAKYKELEGVVNDYNRAIALQSDAKLSLDIREAENNLKKMNSGWLHYAQVVANTVNSSIGLSEFNVDASVPAEFRTNNYSKDNTSKLKKQFAEMYRQGSTVEFEDVKKGMNSVNEEFIAIQKKMSAAQSKKDFRLIGELQPEYDRMAEFKARADEFYGYLETRQDRLKQQKAEIKFTELGIDVNKTKEEFEKIPETIKRISQGLRDMKDEPEIIARLTNEAKGLNKTISDMQIIKQEGGVGYLADRMGLSPQELETVKNNYGTLLTDAEDFGKKHSQITLTEIQQKLGMEEVYQKSRRAQMRGLFIEDSKYNALGHDEKIKYNKLAIDMLEAKRQFEDQKLQSGKNGIILTADFERTLLRATLMQNKLVSEKYANDKNGLEQLITDFLASQLTSRTEMVSAAEQAMYESSKQYTESYVKYLEVTHQDRLSEEGAFTEEYKKFKRAQIEEEVYTSKIYAHIADDVEGSMHSAVLAARQLKIINAIMADLDKKGSGRKKSDTEHIRPDMIAIQKRINEANKKEQEKELADIENFYQQKISLVTKGTEDYKKLTNKDIEEAKKVYEANKETHDLGIKEMQDDIAKRIELNKRKLEINSRVDVTKGGTASTEERIVNTKVKENRTLEITNDNNALELQQKNIDAMIKAAKAGDLKQMYMLAVMTKEYNNFGYEVLQSTQKWTDARNAIIERAGIELNQNEYQRQLDLISLDEKNAKKEIELQWKEKNPAEFEKRNTQITQEAENKRIGIKKAAIKQLNELNNSTLQNSLIGYEEEEKRYSEMLSSKLITEQQFSDSVQSIRFKKESSMAEASGNENLIKEYELRKQLRDKDSEEQDVVFQKLMEEYRSDFEIWSQEIDKKLNWITRFSDVSREEALKQSGFAKYVVIAESDARASLLKQELDNNKISLDNYQRKMKEEELIRNIAVDETKAVMEMLSRVAKEENPTADVIAEVAEMLNISIEAAEELIKKLQEVEDKKKKSEVKVTEVKFKGDIGNIIEKFKAIGQAYEDLKKSMTFEDGLAGLNNLVIATGEAASAIIDVASGIASTMAETANIYMQIELDAIKERKDKSIDALEEQNDKELISKNQYEAQKKNIEKKALEEEKAVKEKQKKWTRITIIMDTAAAIAKVFAQLGMLGFSVAPILAANGIAQLAAVDAQKYDKGGFTGPGMGYRDETGKRVAGVVHEKEVVFEEGITMPNLNELMTVRRLLQSGIKLKDILNPKIKINQLPSLPALPKKVYASGGFVNGISGTLAQMSMTEGMIETLKVVKNSIDAMNQNLVEKKMTVNVTAKTIDPIDVYDLGEEGRTRKDFVYAK